MRPPPKRPVIVIGVECIFTWYWLADLCDRQSIHFILGYALYMKAIHRWKAKNDRIGSRKIAALLSHIQNTRNTDPGLLGWVIGQSGFDN